MKSINKIFSILFCGLAISVIGVSDGFAFDTASGFSFSGWQLCTNSKSKTTAVSAQYSGGTIANNVQALCNCKPGTNRKTNEASYIYPNGQVIALAFPKIAKCNTKGSNSWDETDNARCPGWEGWVPDPGSQVTDFDHAAGCWKGKCKTSELKMSADKKKCEGKDPNLEYDENGNPLVPCDTKSTLKVNINDQEKIVPANTRMDGQCMPTCQSDKGSKIFMDDPTEFVIVLQ